MVSTSPDRSAPGRAMPSAVSSSSRSTSGDRAAVFAAAPLLLGLGLPEDNAHSPNEKFDLDCFEDGQRMSALLWRELTAAV